MTNSLFKNLTHTSLRATRFAGSEAISPTAWKHNPYWGLLRRAFGSPRNDEGAVFMLEG